MSTSGQDAQLQLDALVTAGVQKRDVFADVTSGSKTAIERSGMKKLLEYAEDGDTVVVWRVDRCSTAAGAFPRQVLCEQQLRFEIAIEVVGRHIDARSDQLLDLDGVRLNGLELDL